MPSTTLLFYLLFFVFLLRHCLACLRPPIEPEHPQIVSALTASPTWNDRRVVQKCAATLGWVTTIHNHVLTFQPVVAPVWRKRRILKVEILSLDHPLIKENHQWTPTLSVQLPPRNEFFRFTILYMESDSQAGQLKKHYEWGADAIREGACSNDGNDPPGIGLDIWILMFDGVSLPNAMRTMPKTRSLLERYGAIEMRGHTVAGKNTAENLWPLIMGSQAVDEEFECVSKFSNCTTPRYVDEFPTLWAAYKQKYVTVWGDEWPHLDVFTEYHNGFLKPPTHHSMKPLWADVNKHARQWWEPCAFGQMKALIFFQYGASLLQVYQSHRKFVFFDILSQTHNAPEFMTGLDRPLEQFLETQLLPAMNRTMLWVMADHGAKQGTLPEKAGFQAVVEFGNPLLSITMPSWFASKYPRLQTNLKNNRLSLTTPYDLHTTLLHLQTYPRAPPPHPYGRSLFLPIPHERTCEAAGVPSELCPCDMNVKVESCEGPVYRRAMDVILKGISTLLRPVSDRCLPVGHSHMQECAAFAPNQQGIIFHTTTARGPPFVFRAVFEVAGNGTILLPDGAFPAGRLNRFGSQPACIASQHPDLRGYCMCQNWRPPVPLPVGGSRKARPRVPRGPLQDARGLQGR